MTDTRKPERLRGRAEEGIVRRGTASEHRGVFLLTVSGEKLTLEPLHGNPFTTAAGSELVGREVEVEGFRVGRKFRYRSVRFVGEGRG